MNSRANTVRISAIVTAAILLSSLLTMQLPVAVAEDDHEDPDEPNFSSDVGVLVYTHGFPGHHESDDHDRVAGIEKMLEKRFKTPSEIVLHMPYDWDEGLMKLDENDVEYAIFLYTDMFGPDSTVIHNVTRGVFGGIEEYNVCPGVPAGDGCQYMGQLTEPASKVSDTILVFAEPARPDHPILRNIFVKQAKAVSENSSDEILVLVGHGARSDFNDDAQETELSNAAAFVKKKMGFAGSIGVTAREDWPALQPIAVQEAVDEIKSMLEETGAANVVLVPATGASGFDLISSALEEEGINFVEAPEPFPIGLKEFKKWADQTVRETIEFIEEEEPTESTITPYWERDYYYNEVRKDKQNDTTNNDSNFDIRQFGINNAGNPYMRVKGDAGASVTDEHGIIYGYVFATNAGIYAVTAHLGDDSPGEEHEGNEWHAHKVVLDENNCISSITPDGESRIINKTIVLRETPATSLSKVMTVELTEQDNTTCVTEVFDQGN